MQQAKWEESVCRFIEQEDLIHPGDGVLVGVSGGADSVALLRFLWQMRDRLGICLRCIHVEHGIRGQESLRDQYFVEELCRDLGIEERTISVKDRLQDAVLAQTAVEEAAREARYAVLTQEAEAWEKELGHPVRIALAHHAGDNGETMLFHLVRGTGLEGMRGMPVKRGRIIRPFLSSSRAQVEAYLAGLGQTYCQDSTNTDIHYDRNRLRHQVMPELQKINAQAGDHLGREALYLGQVADYIRQVAKDLLAQSRQGDLLLAEPLKDQPSFLRCQVLYLWLAAYVAGLRDISTAHLEALDQLFAAQTGRRVELPYGLSVARTYEGLEMRCGDSGLEKEDLCHTFSADEIQEGIRIPLPETGKYIEVSSFSYDSKMEIPRKFYTKWFDYDKIKNAIQLRYRRKGDYLTVTASGGRKSLQDYFVNEKVSRWERDRVPLLCDGDHVIWAVGYRISTYYKVDDHTKRILKIQILEENENE